MLRIMLPGAAGSIRDILPVRVSYEIIVVIDVDIVVAAPAAVIAPAAATPGSPHCDPDAKRYRHTRGVITRWWISNRGVRVSHRAVHHGRVITRNINNFGISLFNDDNLLTLDYLRLYFLLLGRL